MSSLALKGKRLGLPPIPQSVYDKAIQMRLEDASFRKTGRRWELTKEPSERKYRGASPEKTNIL